jgi:uncharacterized protein
VIRDSKLARDVQSQRHEGIVQQLQIYGLLFERVLGRPPVRLEVHTGAGALVPVPYEGEASVLQLLRDHRRMRQADPRAYEPVGWTKCSGCGYHDLCWSGAEAEQDVSILAAVRQGRARELRARGLASIGSIPSAIDDPAHRDYFWTGKRNPRRRDFVAGLLESAGAYLTQRPILRSPPELPAGASFAMLDLEGIPPYLDELDRIYLWGLKVCGENSGAYMAAEAGFGPAADREGWLGFLRLAARLLEEHGPDLPFVHWSEYEPTKIRSYVERYGDTDGIAARLLENSFNLLAEVKRSVALPLPSYSLKVVDGYVGFRRLLPEANGLWSIAKYIEATETEDPVARSAIVGQIRAYNEEDLDAMWAVVKWLRALPGITPVP